MSLALSLKVDHQRILLVLLFRLFHYLLIVVLHRPVLSNSHHVRALHQLNISAHQTSNLENLMINFQKNRQLEKYLEIILSNLHLKTTDKSRIESQSNWEFPSLREF